VNTARDCGGRSPCSQEGVRVEERGPCSVHTSVIHRDPPYGSFRSASTFQYWRNQGQSNLLPLGKDHV